MNAAEPFGRSQIIHNTLRRSSQA